LVITVKCRLYPTKEISENLMRTKKVACWVYNNLLKLNMKSKYEMDYALTELKEQYPWLREYYAQMLQTISTKIAGAKKGLEVLDEHGYYNTGKLHPLRHENYNTFSYIQAGFKIERHGNTDLLWLSRIGWMEIRLSRAVFNIKQVTITLKNGKWYALLVCKELRPLHTQRIDFKKIVGIDVGVTKFAHDSNNHEVENPLFYVTAQRWLKRADRRLSRKQNGSKNREKTKSMRARLYERVYNKRRDFLHKLSTLYSKRYDVIFVERLQTLNMVKNHHLAKHVLDSGWGMFKQMLVDKGKLVFEVNPYHTTVDCSKCGNKVQKSLAMRIHRCDICGLVLDRDYNAALNILQRGKAFVVLPMEHREVTPLEIPAPVSMKEERVHRSQTGG
jgi:putative transposase